METIKSHPTDLTMNAELTNHTTDGTRSTVTVELSGEPSAETLRQQLEIQWRDHFHVRDQTWKALQMVALLFVGYIGSALKISDPLLIRTGGAICMLAAFFGAIITIHHRKIQIEKFTYIFNFEGKLRLHQTGLLPDIKAPKPFRLIRIFHFWELANPTFILLMHLSIFVMAAIYVWARS